MGGCCASSMEGGGGSPLKSFLDFVPDSAKVKTVQARVGDHGVDCIIFTFLDGSKKVFGNDPGEKAATNRASRRGSVVSSGIARDSAQSARSELTDDEDEPYGIANPGAQMSEVVTLKPEDGEYIVSVFQKTHSVRWRLRKPADDESGFRNSPVLEWVAFRTNVGTLVSFGHENRGGQAEQVRFWNLPLGHALTGLQLEKAADITQDMENDDFTNPDNAETNCAPIKELQCADVAAAVTTYAGSTALAKQLKNSPRCLQVATIRGRSGAYIDCVEFELTDGTLCTAGNPNGGDARGDWPLFPGEMVTFVSQLVLGDIGNRDGMDTTLFAVCLRTNLGRAAHFGRWDCTAGKWCDTGRYRGDLPGNKLLSPDGKACVGVQLKWGSGFCPPVVGLELRDITSGKTAPAEISEDDMIRCRHCEDAYETLEVNQIEFPEDSPYGGTVQWICKKCDNWCACDENTMEERTERILYCKNCNYCKHAPGYGCAFQLGDAAANLVDKTEARKSQQLPPAKKPDGTPDYEAMAARFNQMVGAFRTSTVSDESTRSSEKIPTGAGIDNWQYLPLEQRRFAENFTITSCALQGTLGSAMDPMADSNPLLHGVTHRDLIRYLVMLEDLQDVYAVGDAVRQCRPPAEGRLADNDTELGNRVLELFLMNGDPVFLPANGTSAGTKKLSADATAKLQEQLSAEYKGRPEGTKDWDNAIMLHDIGITIADTPLPGAGLMSAGKEVSSTNTTALSCSGKLPSGTVDDAKMITLGRPYFNSASLDKQIAAAPKNQKGAVADLGPENALRNLVPHWMAFNEFTIRDLKMTGAVPQAMWSYHPDLFDLTTEYVFVGENGDVLEDSQLLSDLNWEIAGLFLKRNVDDDEEDGEGNTYASVPSGRRSRMSQRMRITESELPEDEVGEILENQNHPLHKHFRKLQRYLHDKFDMGLSRNDEEILARIARCFYGTRPLQPDASWNQFVLEPRKRYIEEMDERRAGGMGWFMSRPGKPMDPGRIGNGSIVQFFDLGKDDSAKLQKLVVWHSSTTVLGLQTFWKGAAEIAYPPRCPLARIFSWAGSWQSSNFGCVVVQHDLHFKVGDTSRGSAYQIQAPLAGGNGNLEDNAHMSPAAAAFPSGSGADGFTLLDGDSGDKKVADILKQQLFFDKGSSSNNPPYYECRAGDGLVTRTIVDSIEIGKNLYGVYCTVRWNVLEPRAADSFGATPDYSGIPVVGTQEWTKLDVPGFEEDPLTAGDDVNMLKRMKDEVKMSVLTLDSNETVAQIRAYIPNGGDQELVDDRNTPHIAGLRVVTSDNKVLLAGLTNLFFSKDRHAEFVGYYDFNFETDGGSAFGGLTGGYGDGKLLWINALNGDQAGPLKGMLDAEKQERMWA